MMNFFKGSPFISGIIAGILGLVLIVALSVGSFVYFAKEDYGDELTNINTLLKETKDPVIQKDYIITGLIMSEEFMDYLDQGVEKGWWTEEFLVQFLIDYSIPIFNQHYQNLIGVLGQTDKATDLKVKLTNVLDKVKVLKAKFDTLDTNRIKNAVNKVTDLINQAKYISPSIKEKVNGAKNKLALFTSDQFQAELKADIRKNIEASFDGTAQELEKFIEEIKADAIDQINQIVQDLLNDIQDQISDVINNILTNLDVDDDHHFTDQLSPLNYIDLYIPEDGYVYDNNGTPKLDDDSITFTTINIGLEKNEEPKLDIIIGSGFTITGKNALLISQSVDIINDAI